MRRRRRTTQYLLCVHNDGYAASLQTRRLYEHVSDKSAEARGLVRVIDESGEDYLDPQKLFATVSLRSRLLVRSRPDKALIRKAASRPSADRNRRPRSGDSVRAVGQTGDGGVARRTDDALAALGFGVVSAPVGRQQ